MTHVLLWPNLYKNVTLKGQYVSIYACRHICMRLRMDYPPSLDYLASRENIGILNLV